GGAGGFRRGRPRSRRDDYRTERSRPEGDSARFADVGQREYRHRLSYGRGGRLPRLECVSKLQRDGCNGATVCALGASGTGGEREYGRPRRIATRTSARTAIEPRGGGASRSADGQTRRRTNDDQQLAGRASRTRVGNRGVGNGRFGDHDVPRR